MAPKGMGSDGTEPCQGMVRAGAPRGSGGQGKGPLGYEQLHVCRIRCTSSWRDQVSHQRGILATTVLPTYFMGPCVLPSSG